MKPLKEELIERLLLNVCGCSLEKMKNCKDQTCVDFDCCSIVSTVDVVVDNLVAHLKQLNKSCWIGQTDSRKDALEYVIELLEE